ncbi:MAG: carbohydrate ABC transporter permease [Microbacterium sp.]
MSVASPRRSTARLLASLALIVFGVAFAAPLVWLLLASVDADASYQIKLPGSLSLDNFAAVLTPELTFLPVWNSVIVSGSTAILTVVLALLTAYPLSRFASRFNRPFLFTILFASCLPITAIMVPVYAMFVQLGFLDSIPAVVLFLTATSLPMAVWMMKSFMDGVPVSLEQAAWLDGASSMVSLWRIVVPLMRPGIAVVGIFVFLQAWGNFFVPFILLLSPEKTVAAVSIYSFFGQYGAIAYGQLAAFSLIYSAPVLLLYLLVTRVIGGSFALDGAVKG